MHEEDDRSSGALCSMLVLDTQHHLVLSNPGKCFSTLCTENMKISFTHRVRVTAPGSRNSNHE